MKKLNIFLPIILASFWMANSAFAANLGEKAGRFVLELSEANCGFNAATRLHITTTAADIEALEVLKAEDKKNYDKNDGSYGRDLDFSHQLKPLQIMVLRVNYLNGIIKDLKKKQQEEEDAREEEKAERLSARKIAETTAENEGKIKAFTGAAVAGTKQFIESICSPRGVAASSAMVFSIVGIKFGFAYLKDALNKPVLAIKSSIPSASERFSQLIFGTKKARQTRLDEVIFEPGLAKYIKTLSQSYLNAIANGAPFRNVLFYGPPGTGKTAVATTIARFIDERGGGNGMDYIYFAASNLDQFSLDEAIKAINGLFTYAQNSPKKLMIIVDECEVLFANRNGNLSEQARKMLTAFLTFTGQPSRDFVIVGLTNRREAFDTASLSRFYEQIYVGAPDATERKRILEKYINDYIKCAKNLVPQELTLLQRLMGKKIKPARKIVVAPDVLSESVMDWLCDQIDGFVGRDIENLVIALQAEAYASANNSLTEQMVREVTMRKVSQRLAQTAEAA